MAIGVARRGARRSGERTLRIPPPCSFPVSHAGGPHVASFVRRSSVRARASVRARVRAWRNARCRSAAFMAGGARSLARCSLALSASGGGSVVACRPKRQRIHTLLHMGHGARQGLGSCFGGYRKTPVAVIGELSESHRRVIEGSPGRYRTPPPPPGFVAAPPFDSPSGVATRNGAGSGGNPKIKTPVNALCAVRGFPA